MAVNAQFRLPENVPDGLVVHNGYLYVSDTGNNCVRRINLTTGIVTLYAGTPEMGGFEGDGGQAVVPEVAGPGVFEFSAAEYTVEENAGVATLEITRTDGGCGELFVEFTTHPGTATVPEDFIEITSGVTFADGETGSKQVLIPIADDANAEPPESFTVEIINWLGDSEIGENFLATVVITDNDGQPAPVITSIDPNKGAAGTSFWVSLKGTNLGGTPTIEVLDGGGITVSELTVRSSEELVARFAIAANAPVGFRQIQVRKANAQVSNPVPFEIRPAGSAPRILSQSQHTTIEYAETARLEVFAAGTGSLTYQWYAGFAGLTDVPIIGATSRTYVTDQLTTTTSFWVRVRNANGVADSQTITITVNPPEAAAFGFSQLLYIPGAEQLLVFSATDALYLAQLYYDPIVSVNLKDQTGTTLINAPNQHFAFFRALPAEQGETYTLKSHHCLEMFYTVIVTPPNDFRYDDEFNFSEMQSDQVYSDGFIWLAEGPQVLTVEKRLCLGFTTDQQTAARCSNLQITSMFPSTLIRGTSPEVEFKGDCLSGVEREHITFFGPDGASTTLVRVQFITEKSPDGKILKAKIDVDRNAPVTTSVTRYKAIFTVPESPPPVEIPFEVTDRTLEIQRFRTVPEKGRTIVTLQNKGFEKKKVRLEIKPDAASSGKARIVNAKHLQEFVLEPGRLEPVTIAGELVSEKQDDVTLRLMESNPGSGDNYIHDEKAFSVVRFQVSEVGFAGGHQMLLWERDGELLPNDGQTTNWIRDGADNGITAKAAYNFNNDQNVESQQVKVFVQLTTIPSGLIILDDTKATVRASLKKSPQPVVLGTSEEMVLQFPDSKTRTFVLDRKKFESGRQGVKLGRYVFDWEISFEKDGLGNNIWTPLGDRLASDKTQTGPHTIYWTYRDPIQPLFFDPRLGPQFPYTDLYDRALEWGCGLVAGGLNGEDQQATPVNSSGIIVKNLTKEIGERITFTTNGLRREGHPLQATDPNDRNGRSAEHTILLSGVLRSIGIKTQPVFVWSGSPNVINKFTYIKDPSLKDGGRKLVTFQFNRPPNDDAEANPHLLDGHAYVKIMEPGVDGFFDPSYGNFDGTRGTPDHSRFLNFTFGECVDFDGKLQANRNKQEGDFFPEDSDDKDKIICNHGENASVEKEPIVPPTVAPGQRFRVTIIMKNNGGTVWPRNTLFLKSISPPSNGWGWPNGGLPPFSIPILPGQTITRDFEVVAPSTPGIYIFQWQMFDPRKEVNYLGQSTRALSITVKAP